ncbi:hypothetical protein [Ammoniphilus sp. CFH 90114]|uniref:hypothetical protein n=1 Tax=Ammoniphilus sp. CFH 90114 TaxID=2493665 RepID=UPI00100E7409|nr:hypothetical protein [Ammoniphilus sp. CFH 90114]RXT07156.1 hypothetical protein EIZ39_13500 [Ammoniphilus sp. CFH 90114]
MADIDDISSRLIITLQERGCEITKENGAANAIIIAIAEAYHLGIEKGIRSGKIEMIELMDMQINDVKSKLLDHL